MTQPEDVQNIYDNLATDDKQLLWIEGTTRRFHETPEPMLHWFDTHFA